MPTLLEENADVMMGQVYAVIRSTLFSTVLGVWQNNSLRLQNAEGTSTLIISLLQM